MKVVAATLMLLLAGCASYDGPGAGGGQTIPTQEPTSSASGASTAPPAVVAQVLTVGDFWITSTTTQTSKGAVTSNATTRVAATERVTMAGGTHDAHRLDTVQGATNTTRYVRTQDHAVLREEHRTQSGASVIHVLLAYDAPCRSMRFPLAVGATWNERCPAWSNVTVTTGGSTLGEGTQSSRVVVNTTVAVVDLVRTTVPAGSFDAYQLLVSERQEGPNQSSAPREGAHWYALTACGLAKRSEQVAGAQSTSELTRFSCERAPQA